MAKNLTKSAALHPSWRDGWHPNCRRFIAHQWADGEESDGGDIWRVIDTDGLKIMAQSDTQKKATLIADALEHLSMHATAEEFEAQAAA